MSQHQQNRNANKGNGNNKGGKTPSLSSKVSCSGCGSPKHKTGDKSCRANGKTCLTCNKVGHFSAVCPLSSNGGGSAKRPPAKSKPNGKAATINQEPTQSNSGSDSEPEADANAMSGSHSGDFFFIGGLQRVVLTRS